MFYSHHILQKRGRYGIIWLAATSRQRLTRRDFCGVNVGNSCDDILSVIINHLSVEERKKMRFSLYLSSQLMYGLSYIHGKQCAMLLDEVMHMVSHLSTFKLLELDAIDLEITVSKAKVTLEPPDMSNAPIDFGILKPTPEPSHHFYESFLVTTPRSSEEAYPGLFDDQQPLEPFPDDFETVHTVRPMDITMPELPIDLEEPIPEMIPAENIEFFDDDYSLLARDSDVLARAGGVGPRVTPDIRDMPTPEAERTARVRTRDRTKDTDRPPRAAPEPPRAPSAPPTPPLPQQPRIDPTAHPSPPDLQIPPLVLDDSPLLLPRGRGTRGSRRRRLIIDQETRLSAAEIRNYVTGPVTQFTVPLVSRLATVSHEQSATSLLRGLSARIIPRRVTEIVNRYHTLPVPTHLPFSFSDSESERSEEVQQQEIIVQDEVLPDEVHEMELAEERRAAESHEGTLDPTLSGLLRSSSIEASDFSSRRLPHISISRDGFIHTLPELQEDVLLETEPLGGVPELDHESILEPIPEPMDAAAVGQAGRFSKPICDYSPVSPERMSPPSSYKSITARLMDTLALIQEAASESDVPNCTTFTAVIERTTIINKKNVALLFNDLLHLHAQKFIIVEQPTMGGEISIQLLTDESGTSENSEFRRYC